jgi:hypothetical protein
MKNRIRWVLAAVLLMGVVFASAATLGYGFSFGTGSAAFSGSAFQTSDRPATAAPAIRSGLIESFDSKLARSNLDLSLAGKSYTPISVATNNNPMFGRNTSFSDLAGATEPTTVSSPGAESQSFGLVSARSVVIGNNSIDGGSVGESTVVSDSTVTTPVPEPETYAMLLAGLVVIVVVSRRRASGKA